MSEHDYDQWVMIGVIHYDGEAEIVASLFESQEIPLVIQGRNHRRMMGILGGQIIEMRLLVPEVRRAEGETLLQDYIIQRDRDLERSDAEDLDQDDPPRLLFNRTGQKMGVALLAAALLGFGLASLSAGVWIATLLLAPLQALTYWAPATTWASTHWGVDQETLIQSARTALPLIDLCIAWGVLLTRALFTRPPKTS